MDFTPIARLIMNRRARRTESWGSDGKAIQEQVLRSLLRRGAGSEPGRRHGFRKMAESADVVEQFRRTVPLTLYEDIRADVMRMIAGEKDVLWPGVCLNFAQSSGTSGGRSKYIPVPHDNLHRCHYAGAADLVAFYLRATPESRMFAGKGMILGGSFANALKLTDPKVKVGDVSATMISKIYPVANFFRVPKKETALIPDWEEKLPRLVAESENEDVTNISGVPSWFLTVLKSIIADKGVEKISEVWPNLEVFFHGGINFNPYREEYKSITSPGMRFFESYNASEGFFAAQHDYDHTGMMLLIDNDVFFEFLPLGEDAETTLLLDEVEEGAVYELVISSSNGLWRYRLGDTVKIESRNPVRISIAGRTKCFINAFGEELMEDNAEKAVATVCDRMGCYITNYTVAPIYAKGGKKGHHQWLIEWEKEPEDLKVFAATLDEELRKLNSDYDAKRSHTIFLDPLEIVSVPKSTFSKWLKSVGSHKLGGQRKVPRLSNDRTIADRILQIIGA